MSIENNVKEYIERSTGMPVQELLSQKDTPYACIGGMERVIEIINETLIAGKRISVVGDYDADGACASAILWMTLRKLGCAVNEITVRLPKRFSEGYGLSDKIIDEIDSGLVLCVDNGIAAFDAIQKAKEKGLTVCVLDHHLSDEDRKVPADIIVDQHVEELRNATENGHSSVNAFDDFCGAGLAYKLAEGYFGSDDIFMDKMAAIAAIATVADSVSLLRDNRNIVIRGLNAINRSLSAGEKECHITLGLLSMLREFNVNEITEDDIAFKLAPLINAAGRMQDDGSKLPCAALCQDEKEIPKVAKMLMQFNTDRKTLTTQAIESAKNTLGENPTLPIIVFNENIPKGLIGIVAGQLAEEYGAPAFVFTRSDENGVWDGSARVDSHRDNFNLKETLDTMKDALVRYGGHAGAAGLAVKEEDRTLFIDTVTNRIGNITSNIGATEKVDIDIAPNEIQETLTELRKYAPFGHGNPAPIIRLKNISIDGYPGHFGRLMGADNQHIKFNIARTQYTPPQGSQKIDILAFNKAAQYLQIGSPPSISVVGKLGSKNDNWGKAIQFMCDSVSLPIA